MLLALIINEKNKKKNSSFYDGNSNCLLIPQEKLLSNSFGSSNIYIDNNFQINQKKIETPIEFIKHKKKFLIQDYFDSNGTNDFIASKELALKKIELNDEILIEEKKKKKKIKNILEINSDKNNKFKEKNKNGSKRINDIVIKNKKSRKRNTLSCVYKHINIEEKKYNSRKKKSNSKKPIEFNNHINGKCENNESNHNSNNNIMIIDNKSIESKDTNYFYKFIIDNANESDEEFHKKFEKIIEKYERESKKKMPISKAFTSKELVGGKETAKYSSSKFCKTKAKDNNFNYSEKIKDIMIKDDNIHLSSISNEYKVINTAKNINSNKNNNKLNRKKEKKDSIIIFNEKVKKFINDEKNDSIISVLNDLM